MSRPFDTTSTLASSLARITGLRSGSTMTPLATLIVLVWAATTVRAMIVSRKGSAGGIVSPRSRRLSQGLSADPGDYPLVQAVAERAEHGRRAQEPDRVAGVLLGEQHPPGAAFGAHEPGLDGVDGRCAQVRGHRDRAGDPDDRQRDVDLPRPVGCLADD